jgi:hypothetical protein
MFGKLWEGVKKVGSSFIGGGGLGAAAGIAGSALQYYGQDKANQENKDIMREQQAWQKEMSDTAHQRETKDLEAAGLNRILSLKGTGASTGNVSSAKIESKFSESSKTALAATELIERIKLMKAQVSKTDAEASSAKSEAMMTNNRNDYIMRHPWMWKYKSIMDMFWPGAVQTTARGVAGAVGAGKIGKALKNNVELNPKKGGFKYKSYR